MLSILSFLEGLNSVSAKSRARFKEVCKNYFKISMNDTILMAVVDRLEDLLNAMGGIGFRIELPGNNVFKEFSTSHPANTKGMMP